MPSERSQQTETSPALPELVIRTAEKIREHLLQLLARSPTCDFPQEPGIRDEFSAIACADSGLLRLHVDGVAENPPTLLDELADRPRAARADVDDSGKSIGSLRTGERVIVIDDLSRGRREWLHRDAELHQAGIRDTAELRSTV